MAFPRIYDKARWVAFYSPDGGRPVLQFSLLPGQRLNAKWRNELADQLDASQVIVMQDYHSSGPNYFSSGIKWTEYKRVSWGWASKTTHRNNH